MSQTTSIWAEMLQGGLALSHSIRVVFSGFKRYRGSAKEIIRQILEDCWNGQFLQASSGHFRQFWTRDFGMSAEALIKLGYRERVKKTLEYALPIFDSVGEVTTTIIGDKPFNLPTYGSDSVPYLIHALGVLGDEKLIKRWGPLLEAWAAKYWQMIWDKKIGLVRSDFAFAGAKDVVVRQSSCYDTCMVGMLDRDLRALRLYSPVDVDIQKILIEKYWTGKYFLDDLSGRKYVSADAQIFPFLTGIIEVSEVTPRKKTGVEVSPRHVAEMKPQKSCRGDTSVAVSELEFGREMLLKVIKTIQLKKMDVPFPIKYTEKRYPKLERQPIRFFVPNYQGDTIWTQMGALWIELVSKIDRQLSSKYIEQYKSLIEKHKNYLELFQPSGMPYRSFFYVTDEGMLWSAIFLSLLS
jgi:hypothetical protein